MKNKYNIDDTVYAIQWGSLLKAVVINFECARTYVNYMLFSEKNGNFQKLETELFSTPEEALKNLVNKFNKENSTNLSIHTEEELRLMTEAALKRNQTEEAKYKIGQNVFLIFENKVSSGEIRGVHITNNMLGKRVVSYTVKGFSEDFKEDLLFPSIEGVLLSLIRNTNEELGSKYNLISFR